MTWLEKIQSLPQKKKIRIIWIVVIFVVIFLVAVWIISTKFSKNVPADTSLFKTIGQGIHDVKENYRQ